MKRIAVRIMMLLVAATVAISNSFSYQDNVPESDKPPAGLAVKNVPQFVVLGFDDNTKAGGKDTGGVLWVLELLKGKVNQTQSKPNLATYDGTPVGVTFYCNAEGMAAWIEDSPHAQKRAFHQAYMNGHEIGNHTYDHQRNLFNGTNHAGVVSMSQTKWTQEVVDCNTWLGKAFPDSTIQDWELDDQKYGAGIPKDSIVGFRAPFLEYNQYTMPVIKTQGFLYDCSVQDGIEPGPKNGTNFNWPYTLDNGSKSSDATPGNDTSGHGKLTPTPGLWELPNYPVMVVPDSLMSKYGLTESVYNKCKKVIPNFTGKITGLDYNLYEKQWGGLGLTDKEVLAILKYTLDLRLSGNRAPMMFGAHTQFYVNSWAIANANCTGAQMRKVIEDFVTYAISKPEVRMVRGKDIIAWCRKPVGLDGISPIVSQKATGSISNVQCKLVGSRISIDLGSALQSDLNIGIYDLKGRLLAARVVASTGESHFEWNLKSLKLSGATVVRISGKFAAAGKGDCYFAVYQYR